MVLPRIALRNLYRQKRRSFLLGGALAFGMFILVVVNGIAGGLVSNLQRNFSDLVSGHIFFTQVEKSEDDRLLSIIRDDQGLVGMLEGSGLKISAITRRTGVMGSVIYSGESSSRQITGVDWTEEKKLPDSLNLLAGDAHSMAGTDGIIVSSVLAEKIGLIPRKGLTYAETANLRRDEKIKWKAAGKAYDLDEAVEKEKGRLEDERGKRQVSEAPKVIGEVVLVQLETIYGQKNVAEFRVTGIYETEMDYSAYVDRTALNGYIEMPEGSYNLCGIVLDDFSHLDRKTQGIHALLGGKYDLVPLDKIKGRDTFTIFSDLKKETFSGQKTVVSNLNNELGSLVSVLTGVQAGCFGLFIVILAVIMVGLVNTFRIVIYERTREIGTMRAIGTQRSQIRVLFLLEASFLALGGAIPGAILGLVALNGISLLTFDSITELSLFLDNGHLGFTVDGWILVASILTVLAFTLAAALIPARKAARMEPAQALRTQF
jgi:putative ABC transport system permease protein